MARATEWFVGTDDVADPDWDAWRGCKSSRSLPPSGDTFGDEIFGCGVERDDRVQGIDTEALDGSNVHEAAIDSHS